MGPLPLCVVLLVQANRNDASDRCLGPAAECECALVCECECECGSRCGTRGRSAAPAPGGSYGLWDHSPCVWFLVCGPIETTLPTGLWDQQRRARSECECGCACYCECARECECECVSGIFQMRLVPRRFTPVCRRRRGAGGVPAPGGSYVVWDHSPCVWFCLCRRIETTLPTVVWDQQRSVNVH